MPSSLFYNPGLTIGLALALEMVAQAQAYHLRMPGIVVPMFMVRPAAVAVGTAFATSVARL